MPNHLGDLVVTSSDKEDDSRFEYGIIVGIDADKDNRYIIYWLGNNTYSPGVTGYSDIEYFLERTEAFFRNEG